MSIIYSVSYYTYHCLITVVNVTVPDDVYLCTVLDQSSIIIRFIRLYE